LVLETSKFKDTRSYKDEFRKQEIEKDFTETHLPKTSNNLDVLFSLEGNTSEVYDIAEGYVAYGNNIIVLLVKGIKPGNVSFIAIFRSEDNGKSWEKVYEYNGNSCKVYNLQYLGNDIFVVTMNDKYYLLSTDLGLTWEMKDAPTEDDGWLTAIYFQGKIVMSNNITYTIERIIEVEGEEDEIIYVDINKLFYTEDFGETWNEIMLENENENATITGGISLCNNIVYLPVDYGYYYSEDLVNWTYVEVENDDEPLTKIITDGEDIFCIAKRNANLNSQVEVPAPDIERIENDSVIKTYKPFGYNLSTVAEYNGKYYFFVPKAIYRLEQDNSFTKICDVETPDKAFYIRNLYVYVDDIFFLSYNNGTRYKVIKIYRDPLTGEFTSKEVLSSSFTLRYSPEFNHDSSYLYAYGSVGKWANYADMFRSDDSGESWTKLQSAHIMEMVTGKDRLFGLSSDNQLYYSTNFGSSWSRLTGGYLQYYDGEYFIKKGSIIVTYPVYFEYYDYGTYHWKRYFYFDYSIDDGIDWTFVRIDASGWGEGLILDANSLTLYRTKDLDNIYHISASPDFGNTWYEYVCPHEYTPGGFSMTYIGNDSFVGLDKRYDEKKKSVITFDLTLKTFNVTPGGSNSSYFRFNMYRYRTPFTVKIENTNQTVKVEDALTFRAIKHPTSPQMLYNNQYCVDYANDKFIFVYASDFPSPIDPHNITVLSSYNLDNYETVCQLYGKRIKINTDIPLCVLPNKTLLLPVVTYVNFFGNKRLDLLAIPC